VWDRKLFHRLKRSKDIDGVYRVMPIDVPPLR
jgi:hypothetical protein